MDPDTTKKVDDLLGMVEGISSEIDVKAELDRIVERLGAIEQKVERLARRVEALERDQRERKKAAQKLKEELEDLAR
ncbi:MAG TPA: hypothetical protein PLS81_06470 [Deltaproteobacteria bacterium]|nr:hypothetical protein [Deltaproteobacteria bacterium]HOM29084.1 hypothetical protein [Deltaproteobacteria bacterium]HPP80083.1 hypothetical protein [Deltaproteobacteria bacterium]